MKNRVEIAGAEARHDEKAGPEARHAHEARQPSAEARHAHEARHEEKKHRPMLRNANINYSHGTFFVTIQAAFNKTIFGAIVGNKSVLNELGKAIQESLQSLDERYPGTEVIEFIEMPNHVHVILRLARRRDNHKHQLGYVIGRFKGWISKIYRDMLAQGQAVDVGPTPWQRDYWDKLVTTDEQLEAYRRYIRQNPAKWTRDRFGAVTAHSFGEIGLLNARLIGFVASQGAWAEELKPRLLWRKAGPEARHDEKAGPEARQPSSEASHDEKARQPDLEASHAQEAQQNDPVISTFTSAQERAILRKLLAKGRRFVKIYPGGIPPPEMLEPEVAEACKAGNALLISPVPTGTGINKQRAVWCNEYVLKNSAEVWTGEITPGHTLESLVKALRQRCAGAEARHDEKAGPEARHAHEARQP